MKKRFKNCNKCVLSFVIYTHEEQIDYQRFSVRYMYIYFLLCLVYLWFLHVFSLFYFSFLTLYKLYRIVSMCQAVVMSC